MRPVIALLSDFGSRDHYAGTMKGVMLGICPDATLVDITHDVPAHDVVDRYDRDNVAEHLWSNYNFGLGFKKVFEQQKEELTIDGRYSDGVERSGELLHGPPFTCQYGRADGIVNECSVK